MTETNDPRAGYVTDVEEELYLEALEEYVDEWIAIVDGTLIHSRDPDDIAAALPPGAFTSGKALVTFIGGRPAHRHVHY